MITKEFDVGERVTTPGGKGTVAFRRMAPPNYSRVMMYSVILDKMRHRSTYRGTSYQAVEISPLPEE